jgi:hypothetical protein
MGALVILAGVSGEIPDSIDSDNAELVILVLFAACVVGIVLAFRTVQKATSRLLVVAVLAAAGAGLWVQRQNLQDCAGQCTVCHVFGREVLVTDPDDVCS